MTLIEALEHVLSFANDCEEASPDIKAVTLVEQHIEELKRETPATRDQLIDDIGFVNAATLGDFEPKGLTPFEQEMIAISVRRLRGAFNRDPMDELGDV